VADWHRAGWEGFYSAAQVSRLTGVPRRTLYDWKARGIIVPSVQIIDAEGVVVDEGYSYADLAIIKLMRSLRTKRLNLRSVGIALRHLYERFGPPTSPEWTGSHVYVVGRDVLARRPDEWDTTVATGYGQRAELRVLGGLCEEEAAILIPKDFGAYVEIDLNVMGGQPVIKDTRILTSTVAMMSDQGVSLSELADLYEPIPREAIRNAIGYEKALDEALVAA
jgi:uncharacterized protein (DUF433 family)/DNA-binding transcriptional MerR regulator